MVGLNAAESLKLLPPCFPRAAVGSSYRVKYLSLLTFPAFRHAGNVYPSISDVIMRRPERREGPTADMRVSDEGTVPIALANGKPTNRRSYRNQRPVGSENQDLRKTSTVRWDSDLKRASLAR